VKRLLAALAVTGLLLAGCGGSDDATPVATPTPSPTPTPASVVWADGVCRARQNLNAAVAAFGRNLTYDVTSDRSALDQIDRQVRLQLLSVGQAANDLGTAVQAVPVDFQQANDFVVTVTKAKTDATQALDATRTHLDAMVHADTIITGVAEAGQALIAAKAAFAAGSTLVSTVTDGVSSAGDQVSAAFDAAPACQDASASPAAG
jgi:hypothetical protein